MNIPRRRPAQVRTELTRGAESTFVRLAMIDVGDHGRCWSMRRKSHTSRSKFFNWDRLMVLRFRIFPLNHHPGREIRLKRSIASTVNPASVMRCRSCSSEYRRQCPSSSSSEQ